VFWVSCYFLKLTFTDTQAVLWSYKTLIRTRITDASSKFRHVFKSHRKFHTNMFTVSYRI